MQRIWESRPRMMPREGITHGRKSQGETLMAEMEWHEPTVKHRHKWNREGAKCDKCGDKDWMCTPCDVPDETTKPPLEQVAAQMAEGIEAHRRFITEFIYSLRGVANIPSGYDHSPDCNCDMCATRKAIGDLESTLLAHIETLSAFAAYKELTNG